MSYYLHTAPYICVSLDSHLCLWGLPLPYLLFEMTLMEGRCCPPSLQLGWGYLHCEIKRFHSGRSALLSAKSKKKKREDRQVHRGQPRLLCSPGGVPSSYRDTIPWVRIYPLWPSFFPSTFWKQLLSLFSVRVKIPSMLVWRGKGSVFLPSQIPAVAFR